MDEELEQRVLSVLAGDSFGEGVASGQREK